MKTLRLFVINLILIFNPYLVKGDNDVFCSVYCDNKECNSINSNDCKNNKCRSIWVDNGSSQCMLDPTSSYVVIATSP